jgi:hypothetical protein
MVAQDTLHSDWLLIYDSLGSYLNGGLYSVAAS